VRWFIKRETFRRPAAELKQAIAAHKRWVADCRQQGIEISSGFLVDSEGKPGGGGLLLLQASDYDAALALIQQDPMLLSGGVEWELHEWISSVGQLATDAPSQSFTR
jgi:uncharacterized protein YciI